MSAIRLGPFELQRMIGRGGMAEVWLGRHRVQGVEVAVKIMTGPVAANPLYLQAFNDEVRAVAGLSHPNIVTVFDYGEVGSSAAEASSGLFKPGSPYLVMELASGGSLESIPMPLAYGELRTVMLVLLDALAHAHARGVIHRDLKPENVLIATDGDVRPGIKLTDFGIAHAMDRRQDGSEQEMTMGTPEYMAPEQVEGYWRDYGPWTDLYALGCMAFELASGDPPFLADTPQQVVLSHLYDDRPPMKCPFPVPKGFGAWVYRMIQRDPRDRFQNAADAAWALAQLPDLDEGDAGPSRPSLLSEVVREAPEVSVRDTMVSFRQTINVEGRRRASTLSFDNIPRERRTDRRPDQDLPLAEREAPPLPETWERPEDTKLSMQLVGAGLGLYGLRTVPLVDRQEERDRIWETLAEVTTTDEPRVLLLHGAAGNGKSRLVEWMCQRALELGAANLLVARHSAAGSLADGLPRMIAQHLRCVGLERPEVRERVAEVLGRADIEDGYEIGGLTQLIAPAPEGETAVVRFSSREERYAFVRRHILRAAEERPVIVWLDDVQWGEDSLGFARYLIDNAAGAEVCPVLVLMTVRDEALGERPEIAKQLLDLMQREGSERIEIGPLHRDDHSALVQELLGLEGELAHQVEERTAGNPLFAVQLVGDWVQRGVLEVADRGFVLRRGEQAILPDDVYAVWAARIERLLVDLPRADEPLMLAAILGREVVPDEWAALCGTVKAVLSPDLLPTLFGQRLAMPGEVGWSFAHEMLRETLERRAHECGRWAEFQRAAADTLRRHYPPDWRGVDERVAYHLLAAGDDEDAIIPLIQAARARRESSEHRAAHELLDKRDAAMRRIGIDESDSRWGHGWVLRSWIASNQGQVSEAYRWSGMAAERARRHGWKDVLPQALLGLGVALRDRGDIRAAQELTEEALTLYEAANLRLGMAFCLQGLGVIARYKGELVWAQTQVTRALNLHERIGNMSGVAQCTLRLAEIFVRRGDRAESVALVAEARRCYEELGERLGVALCVNGAGDVMRLSGDPDAAEPMYREAIERFAHIESSSIIYPRRNLGYIALARRDFAEAMRILEGVRDEFEDMERPGDVWRVSAALLPCYAWAEDWGAWDEAMALANELTESLLVDTEVATGAQRGADLAAEKEQHARAAQAYRLAISQWRRLGESDQVDRLRRSLGAVELLA